MSEFGMMGVDWEERVNFDRMRRERLKKAQDAMEKSGVDALFVFALEDVRYLTEFRSHLGPVTILGLAAAVLPRGGDPILCTLDIVLVFTPNSIPRRDNCSYNLHKRISTSSASGKAER